jgi:hypothetical protein
MSESSESSPSLASETLDEVQATSQVASTTNSVGLLDNHYAAERKKQLDVINKLQSLG